MSDDCSRVPFKEDIYLCLEVGGSGCEHMIYLRLKDGPEYRACKEKVV